MPIPIYSYLDYRQFLRDLTREKKGEGRFNLRDFAKKAEIRAPGYLKMVIDGRRNLTIETAQKFCHAFEITGRERDYFEKLVLYNQTADPDIKQEYFGKLNSLRPRSIEFLRTKRLARYLSRPHYPCIREMVVLKDFKEDPKWIARRCLPPISPAEAREALDTLIELGMLRRDGGRLVQSDEFISTRERDTQEAEAYHFHEAMLDKARRALPLLPQGERHYYGLTLPITKKMFHEMVNEFYTFRDRFLNRANSDPVPPEEVYQINIQIFPLTGKGGNET